MVRQSAASAQDALALAAAACWQAWRVSWGTEAAAPMGRAFVAVLTAWQHQHPHDPGRRNGAPPGMGRTPQQQAGQALPRD